MPAAAARADNNNRLRRWRKTCAIMTKGWQTQTLYIPQSPRIKQALYQTLNSYERAPKLISPLLPLLFTEQILTAMVLLQAYCLWYKNDGVNAIVRTQSRSNSASVNVSVRLSAVDNGELPVWSGWNDFVGYLMIKWVLYRQFITFYLHRGHELRNLNYTLKTLGQIWINPTIDLLTCVIHVHKTSHKCQCQLRFIYHLKA